MRRNDINEMFAAELAIREAMLEVESLGAHVKLTNAMVLLAQAKEEVSDYIDDQNN